MFDNFVQRLNGRWAELHLSLLDRAVLCAVGLIGIAWLPIFAVITVPRIGIALMLAPLGLALIGRGVLKGDLSCRLAAALCGWAVICALLSPTVYQSFVGNASRWSGAIHFVITMAFWGLGRWLGVEALRLLPLILTGAALFNGVIATLQVIFDVTTGDLRSYSGRASGTMGNPILYGSFMAGVAAYWVVRTSATLRVSSRQQLLVAALTFSVGLSGSRIAVAVIVLAVAWSLMVRRSLSAGVTAASAAVGLVSSSFVTAINSSDVALASRVADGQGFSLRFAAWRIFLRAWWERPIQGWGLGAVQHGMERQIDAAYVRENIGPEGGLLGWDDPHNMVLHLLVGTGVVGIVLMAAFLYSATRGRRDATLHWMAAGMIIPWMLQPASVETVPIVLLLIGAATRADSAGQSDCDISDQSDARRATIPQRRLLALGAVPMVVLLGSTFLIDFGLNRSRLSIASVGAAVYSDDYLDRIIAVSYRDAPADSDIEVAATLAEAHKYAARAAQRVEVSEAWRALGEIEIVRGDFEGAAAAIDRALEIQPWSPTVLALSLALADRLNDFEGFAEAMGRVCEIEAPFCDPDADPTTYDPKPVGSPGAEGPAQVNASGNRDDPNG